MTYFVGGVDYIEVVSLLMTFPTNSRNGDQMCISVRIIDDATLEPTKSLSVVLNTSDSNVNIVNERYSINIWNNDCKFFSL